MKNKECEIIRKGDKNRNLSLTKSGNYCEKENEFLPEDIRKGEV